MATFRAVTQLQFLRKPAKLQQDTPPSPSTAGCFAQRLQHQHQMLRQRRRSRRLQQALQAIASTLSTRLRNTTRMATRASKQPKVTTAVVAATATPACGMVALRVWQMSPLYAKHLMSPWGWSSVFLSSCGTLLSSLFKLEHTYSQPVVPHRLSHLSTAQSSTSGLLSKLPTVDEHLPLGVTKHRALTRGAT